MQVINAVIAAGQAVSNELVLSAKRVIGLAVPAGWAAAGIAFEVSPDNVNWYPMYDEKGAEVTLTVAAGHLVTFPTDLMTRFDAVKFVKIVSGTNAANVAQTSGATVGVITHDPSEF